jgi:hypothetical protein
MFASLKRRRSVFVPAEVIQLFDAVDRNRVEALSQELAQYISRNLPVAISRKRTLADYRINPYVVMTTAASMDLQGVEEFAQFLVHSKLYAGLETSFGRSIEAVFFSQYPIGDGAPRWSDPKEKIAEAQQLAGLTREQKARRRTESVWREIDKSCIINDRRYLVSVKSGPNCINDTQVEAMKSAIVQHHRDWLGQTRQTYPHVSGIDVVIGLTYGTDRTTNNKENQILVKLLEHGFKEEDRDARPGVLIDEDTGTVRVYRHIGRSFWAFIGNPANPEQAEFAFLEIMLALAKALARSANEARVGDSLRGKILQLSDAIGRMAFPRGSLPPWVAEGFTDVELAWLAAALSAFYDAGI